MEPAQMTSASTSYIKILTEKDFNRSD